MTDNEIIKALECCICSTSRNDCEDLNCPACKEIGCYFMNRSTEYYPESLIQEIGKSVLDLINRQKAEIERLKNQKCLYAFDGEFKDCIKAGCFYRKKEDEGKSEAIIDFAEKLKEKLKWDTEFENMLVFEIDIDNLVKEMTEE